MRLQGGGRGSRPAHWHASVPGATWPNRNFAHAATSENTVDIEIGLYDAKTVFELLEDAAAAVDIPRHDAWRLYYDGMAQVLAFGGLWSDGRAANWHPMAHFYAHVERGDLPWYSFIERPMLGRTCGWREKRSSINVGRNADSTLARFSGWARAGGSR